MTEGSKSKRHIAGWFLCQCSTDKSCPKKESLMYSFKGSRAWVWPAFGGAELVAAKCKDAVYLCSMEKPSVIFICVLKKCQWNIITLLLQGKYLKLAHFIWMEMSPSCETLGTELNIQLRDAGGTLFVLKCLDFYLGICLQDLGKGSFLHVCLKTRILHLYLWNILPL